MNYVISLLEKEIKILNQCLSEWDCEQYPEAKKQREIKLKQMQKALSILNTEDLKYCTCVFPSTDSRDTFSMCNNCHKNINVIK